MGNAASDAEAYRAGYPGKADEEPPLDEQRANLAFYLGEIASQPDGAFIDEIHEQWFGNYRLLEVHHGYIQWIFPIREQGLNQVARPLTLHEANAIQRSRSASRRVVKSYEVMLDFYGCRLADEATGAVERAHHWVDRYRNLNTSFHNFLRITRMLKSLGELGLTHYQAPLAWHFAHEVFENGQLASAEDSLCDYWIPVVRNDAERDRLLAYVRKHRLAGDDTAPSAPSPASCPSDGEVAVVGGDAGARVDQGEDAEAAADQMEEGTQPE